MFFLHKLQKRRCITTSPLSCIHQNHCMLYFPSHLFSSTKSDPLTISRNSSSIPLNFSIASHSKELTSFICSSCVFLNSLHTNFVISPIMAVGLSNRLPKALSLFISVGNLSMTAKTSQRQDPENVFYNSGLLLHFCVPDFLSYA